MCEALLDSQCFLLHMQRTQETVILLCWPLQHERDKTAYNQDNFPRREVRRLFTGVICDWQHLVPQDA